MSERQVIKKASIANKFIVFWQKDGEEVPDSRIVLDFNPIIDRLAGLARFCVLHYQAKPKGLRKYGVFHDGEYYSRDDVSADCKSFTLLLDESAFLLPPNAVLVYPHAIFHPDSNLIYQPDEPE